MEINERECHKAGLDYEEVHRIAKGISRYANQADKLGIEIFGGSSGSLRFKDDKSLEGRPLILAFLDGRYDGGCGACYEDEKGFLRGE